MPRLVDAALVAAGGAFGSVARHLATLALAALLGPSFPYGTLAVNVTGSFVAGLLLGLDAGRGVSPSARLLLVTGFLGGYTTFSAFGVETVRVAEQHGLLAAGVNVTANVAIGIAAAATGLTLGRAY